MHKNNERLKNKVLIRFIKYLDVLIMTAIFGVGLFMCCSGNMMNDGFIYRVSLFILIYFVLYALIGKIYDAFKISINRISEIIYSQILTMTIVNCIMFALVCLVSFEITNLMTFLMIYLFQVVVAVLWGVGSHKWYYKKFLAKKSAVVYECRMGMEKLIKEYGLSKKYLVQMTMNVSDCMEDLSQLEEMEVVFLSGVHSRDRNIILKYCMSHDIEVLVIPRVGDVLMSGAKPIHMFHLPMLQVRRYDATPEYLFIKRFMDISISLIALILFSPVMLIVAIAIKAYDGGPVIYSHIRLTKDGKEFPIYKFRSMKTDAEKDGVARLSTGEKDNRITPVGAIIRKLRLDELPQLINIVRGELSIVGPRPERPEIAEQYEKVLPEFALRLEAKAGLTGYAQVYGKYNTTPYDKLQMDLMYIAHPSIVEDIKIIMATIKILFMPESTEGVELGATTALDKDFK